MPTIRKLDIGLVAYAPLSGAGAERSKKWEDIKDGRARMPRYQSENFYKNLQLVEKIKIGSAEKGCTSQLTIAWLVAQGEDIPCPTRVSFVSFV